MKGDAVCYTFLLPKWLWPSQSCIKRTKGCLKMKSNLIKEVKDKNKEEIRKKMQEHNRLILYINSIKLLKWKIQACVFSLKKHHWGSRFFASYIFLCLHNAGVSNLFCEISFSILQAWKVNSTGSLHIRQHHFYGLIVYLNLESGK